VHHAVGHRRRDAPGTQQTQSAHPHRAGGGAVAIEVADDDDMPVLRDRIRQQGGGVAQSAQQIGRQQLRQPRLRLFHRQRTARFV